MARLAELTASQPATFESKLGEQNTSWNKEVGPPWGFLGSMIPEFAERSVWPNPSWDHLAEALEGSVKSFDFLREAALLTEDPILRGLSTLSIVFGPAQLWTMSHSEKWTSYDYGGEKALVDIVNAYEYRTHSPVFKSIGSKFDHFLGGMWVSMAALHYGALDSVRTYAKKATAAFLEVGLAKSHAYNDMSMEIWVFLTSALPPILSVGERATAVSVLAAAGFGWDDVGFEACWPGIETAFGALGTFPKATFHTVVKLYVFLASAEGALSPAEVLAWLPSPAELGELSARSFIVNHDGDSTLVHCPSEDLADLCVAGFNLLADREVEKARANAWKKGKAPSAKKALGDSN